MHTKIFVYGTLKHGFRNAPLLEGQTPLGKAVIPGSNYTLINVVGGNFPFPGLIQTDKGCPVYGEVHEVTESCLDHLDRLEGVSHGLYARTKVNVILLDGRLLKDVTAYVYTGKLRTEPCGACWPPEERARWRLADKTFSRVPSGDDVEFYELTQPGCQPILTDNLEEMCNELAKTRSFFGGEKGSYDEWRKAINEVFQPTETFE